MNTNTLPNVFLLKRSIDLSLLRQGFHIPPEFHALVYAALGRATAEAIANGFLTEADLQKRSEKGSSITENGQKNGHGKRSDVTISDEEQPKFKIPEFPSKIVEDVYKAIKLNRKAKYSWLQDNLGVSEATIKRAIADLKELRYIDPEHSKVKGEWQLLK